MPKRKKESDSEERIREKIRKYEEKLARRTRRLSPSPQPLSPSPTSFFEIDDESNQNQEQEELQNVENIRKESTMDPPEKETSKDEEQITDENLDEEVLAVLGDAPQETKFGPPIHKDLASRWTSLIKSGLEKETRNEMKKKYLTPENCATIVSPKLNLEARAAITEAAVKRDKILSAKQTQIGCALSALGIALSTLCKDKTKLPTINILSDASRLLCDHLYQESITRRNFVLAGLDQSTRDSVKDTEVDQWLFGESFAEKLKASKAIKKSGQEISINKGKKPPQSKPHLNYKGPPVSQLKNRAPRFGPSTSYQHNRPKLTYQQPRWPLQKNQSHTQTKPPYQSRFANNHN